MARIAIVHYTAAPAIGGVEQCIEAQCKILAERGHTARLVVAMGSGGDEVRRIAELHPSHPTVVAAARELAGSLPTSDHPLVESLVCSVLDAIRGCDTCCVHNAFTMYLNPFLTVALHRLAREGKGLRWVNWCYDLSLRSAYWPELSTAQRRAVAPDAGITHVAISESRRQDLVEVFGLNPREIDVIPPPLDVLAWIKAGDECRSIWDRLGLVSREPVVLVPAKLLPHKNLTFAVEVAATLRADGGAPMVMISGAPSPHEQDRSDVLAGEILDLASRLGALDALCLLSALLGKPPSRACLRDLMLLSEVVLLPSGEEGYGVPIVEAGVLRAPVLCADIPPFREVGGRAVHYFAPDASPQEVASQVMALARSPINDLRRQAVDSDRRFREGIDGLLL